MFEIREENGFSTPHVLSMRSYAHTQAKDVEGDFLSKHAILPLFRGLMKSQVSQINQPNMLTISTGNTYPTHLES